MFALLHLRLLLGLVLIALARPDPFTLSALVALLLLWPVVGEMETGKPAWLHRLEAITGPVAAAAVFLPRGAVGAMAASTWLAATLAGAAHAALRRRRALVRPDLLAVAELLGRTGPVIGAAAWVAARHDGALFGFREPITTLTVTHFHFVFGALPLALAALTRAAVSTATPGAGMRLRLALAATTGLPVAIGLSFLTRTDPARAGGLEAACACAYAAALTGWFATARRAAPLRPLRATLTLAGLLLIPGVALGAGWACTLATGTPYLDFAGMARTHGVLNALGTLTLVLAAAQLRPAPAETVGIPDPAHPAPVAPPAGRFAFRDDVTETLAPFTPATFARARHLLLTYDFYPPEVMRSRTAFGEAGRPPQPGDAIGMLLFVPLLPGLPPLRLPAMTRVHVVTDTPAFAALGYRPTTRHYGRGEWVAELSHDRTHIRLRIRSVITPTHPLALLGLPLYRTLQVRARHLALRRLQATLRRQD